MNDTTLVYSHQTVGLRTTPQQVAAHSPRPSPENCPRRTTYFNPSCIIVSQSTMLPPPCRHFDTAPCPASPASFRFRYTLSLPLVLGCPLLPSPSLGLFLFLHLKQPRNTLEQYLAPLCPDVYFSEPEQHVTTFLACPKVHVQFEIPNSSTGHAEARRLLVHRRGERSDRAVQCAYRRARQI